MYIQGILRIILALAKYPYRLSLFVQYSYAYLETLGNHLKVPMNRKLSFSY